MPSVTARCLPSGAQPPATTNLPAPSPLSGSTATGRPGPSATWRMRPGQPHAMRVPSPDQATAAAPGGKDGMSSPPGTSQAVPPLAGTMRRLPLATGVPNFSPPTYAMKCPSGDQNPGEKAPDAISFRSEPSGFNVYNCEPSVVTAIRLPSGDHEANHTLKPWVICFLS